MLILETLIKNWKKTLKYLFFLNSKLKLSKFEDVKKTLYFDDI